MPNSARLEPSPTPVPPRESTRADDAVRADAAPTAGAGNVSQGSGEPGGKAVPFGDCACINLPRGDCRAALRGEMGVETAAAIGESMTPPTADGQCSTEARQLLRRRRGARFSASSSAFASSLTLLARRLSTSRLDRCTEDQRRSSVTAQAKSRRRLQCCNEPAAFATTRRWSAILERQARQSERHARKAQRSARGRACASGGSIVGGSIVGGVSIESRAFALRVDSH